MATSTAKKAAKGKGRARSGGEVDAAEVARLVGQLREGLGKKLGVDKAPRSLVSKLLGASSGSVFNWENGTAAPTRRSLDLIRSRLAELEAGTLQLDPDTRVRGGRRPAPAKPTKAREARGSSPAIAGEANPIYANAVNVQRGSSEVRIRFGLALPGAGSARVVADVLVPADVLGQIARG